MDLELKLNVSQKLILSQALKQSLVFLQLPLCELGEYIRELSMSNPLIDVTEAPSGDISLDYASGMEEAKTLKKEIDSVNDNDSEKSAITASFDDFFEDSVSHANAGTGGNADDFSAFLSKPQTFSEFLHAELGLRGNIEEPYLSLTDYLIDCLSSTGYLDIPVSDLADELSVPVSDMEEALFTLQSLDPPGVGARTLSECLLIQLSQLDERHLLGLSTDSLIMLIMKGLPLLAKHDFRELSRLLGLSEADTKKAADIIKTLNPIPSRGFFSDGRNAVIIPDAYITKTESGFDISINKKAMPSVTVNDYYRSLISNEGSEPETVKYLKSKLREANELLTGLDRRASTLMQVISLIVSKQSDFFGNGGALRSLTRNEIAEELSLSSSTVSRAVKDKYIRFDGHIIPLDHFFSNAVASEAGVDISSRALRDQLKRIIDSEDRKKPLSDQALEEYFSSVGISISRRTIAKYRQLMNIPPASGRRIR